MRQRHKPWADDFLTANSQLVIPEPGKYRGHWQSVFGNENPIHLEIGTGKGQFLAGMAKQYPDVNFIGIEISKSVIVTAAQKVMEVDRDNIVLLNIDANHLRDVFADNEIATVYLNFSDPWPKNRHEKRRLTFQAFLEKYQTILDQAGEVVLKTDNRGLFEYSLVSFSAFGMQLQEVNLDLHKLQDPTNIMTEYEEKFSAKGQVIYRCRARFL
ncbi:tRNA (guanosine(46)-N7)-methyltransferase TrmB [Virgibacillus dakarensis]|uniref:tRNA (guanine-N(7)-)-methyltransferase n=1 Tax=Lentibacillus populi TaxID=1827502 RepID=A0A9W5TTH4_9BACI|nr:MULTISPECIES: tRNA (guanosine(46)-N7)-methyltransferase TrmB [Bacillaceae]MBT2216627.1 tRNA (guanosine(46)-N7)-methyltransferase TrmB [Virgibacillus dakarensis]MTW87758.1 tRNA (guanosine(46)-N7)-methyltransferase TrmB [Virgibacillus dakarensis]GGB27074.1 tRNA (guanine-N(7)-)-methyltransferase [Lentibacillus populi]